MSGEPTPPPKRFPVRRLTMLLGVVIGAAYLYSGLEPAVRAGRAADSAEIALGLAILLPSAFMFWRYHP